MSIHGGVQTCVLLEAGNVSVQVTTVQCPKPENPVNGNAVYTSYAYNSIVSYECKYGYTVVGATTRRCGADRKWTGKTPTCQEINCGSPGVLYNGWIENIEAGESHDARPICIPRRVY
ncbi:hypothetical protein K0M31_010757 [Melipona bicolor]|uniref:Sushi domain-containing protein n=1 Tax=Melipona bicolor TaxID=60889 RepID=A0AA40FKT9_9HYME|nr:hypothetical protein K0M31_010757 [Melipona bicolor]